MQVIRTKIYTFVSVREREKKMCMDTIGPSVVTWALIPQCNVPPDHTHKINHSHRHLN